MCEGGFFSFVFGTLIEEVDHKNLSVNVSIMKNKFASVEVFIETIWDYLFPILQKEAIQLYELKLIETPNIYAIYRGEVKRI